MKFDNYVREEFLIFEAPEIMMRYFVNTFKKDILQLSITSPNGSSNADHLFQPTTKEIQPDIDKAVMDELKEMDLLELAEIISREKLEKLAFENMPKEKKDAIYYDTLD